MSGQSPPRSPISANDFFRLFDQNPALLPRIMAQYPGVSRGEAVAMHYIQHTTGLSFRTVADYRQLQPVERDRLLRPLGQAVFTGQAERSLFNRHPLAREFGIEYATAQLAASYDDAAKLHACSIINGHPRLREELRSLRLDEIFYAGNPNRTLQQECDQALRPIRGAPVRMPPAQTR